MTHDDPLAARLREALDDVERDRAIAYLSEPPLAAGETVAFPRAKLTAPWPAVLGFVDRDPQANWAHAARYVLLSREDDAVLSVDAELPPFARGGERRWRIAYRAPGVPDGVLPNLE